MLELINQDILLVSVAALIAGFVDSIVGGGGLVQLPALFILFPNFSVPMAVGTNRFSSFMGTAVAAYQYLKKVKISTKIVLLAGISAGVMSFIGANISSLISQQILKPIVLIMMSLIAIYTFMNKNLGQIELVKYHNKQLTIAFLMLGGAVGFYNGFVGPGTGSLLVFGFVSIIGFNFLKASAMAKVVNFIADVSSLIFFLLNGFVVFKLAIPMMICNMIGSYVGSKTALKNGSGFIRIMFLIIVILLLIRFGYDILKSQF